MHCIHARENRIKVDEENRRAKEKGRNPREKIRGWCNEVHDIMKKYEIVKEWNENVEEKNNVAVWRWWKGNDEEQGVQKLVEGKQREWWGRFYLECKGEWGEEEYLNEKGNKKGRIWKTRMRAGAIPLQAELFREHRSYTDKCNVCGMRAVENQQHMLVECTAYQYERGVMFKVIRDKLNEEQASVVWSSSEELTVWLLSNNECDEPIRTFLDAAFNRRTLLLGG